MSEGEVKKPATGKEEPELTAAQRAYQQKLQEKAIEKQRLDYVKGLNRALDMKELQVKELELSLRYVRAKVELDKLKPEIDKIEEEEAKAEAEMREKMRLKQEELTKKEEKPKITVVKQGESRLKD